MPIIEICGGSIISMSSRGGGQLSLVLDPMAGQPVIDVIDLERNDNTYIITSAGGGTVPKEGITSLVINLSLPELITLIEKAGHISDPIKFAESVHNKDHATIEL